MLYLVFLARLSIVVSLDLRQYLTLNGYLAGICSMTSGVKEETEDAYSWELVVVGLKRKTGDPFGWALVVYSLVIILRWAQNVLQTSERCFPVYLDICLPMLLFQILVVFFPLDCSLFYEASLDSPLTLFIVSGWFFNFFKVYLLLFSMYCFYCLVGIVCSTRW